MSKLKRVEHSLFFLLILLLPTQLGIHFWPDWAGVFGIRVDYLAPTVYLTDLLVVGILLSWWWDKRKDIGILRYWDIKKVIFVVSLYLSLLVSSLLVAQNQGAALYKLVKLIEFSLLGFYVFKNFAYYILRSTIYITLSVAILYSSTIAWSQFLLGHTINGPLWLLGERTFDTNTPGIALETIRGVDYLRPYATFPHPNVLAGFLLISLLLLQVSSSRFKTKAPNFQFLNLVCALAISAIIITFSHSAWVAWLAALCFLKLEWFKKHTKTFTQITLLVAITFSLAIPGLAQNVDTSTLPEEIGKRIELSRAAMHMLADYPLTGVGLGNFIVRLPEYGSNPSVSWWLQPVHNVFLLTLAETGLIGLGFVVWFLFYVFRKPPTTNYILPTTLIVILITGMADHYWLTLQQGQLMLAIVFGASIGKMK